MKAHLNIIARSHEIGANRDAEILRAAASEAGYQVTVNHSRSIPFFAGWFGQKTAYDLNIFLDRISPRWLGTAGKNVLIPDLTAFPEGHLPLLKKMDAVFCKTRHALKTFEKHHPACRHSGFTSRDLFRENIPRKKNGVLHIAGKNLPRGTDAIIGQWERHPEWPRLTLLQHKDNAPLSVPRNVDLRTDEFSDDEIVTLMNEHPIHLCPSLSESWGHQIVEAMGCGAIVITTAAAPMNEWITGERGIVTSWSKSEQINLGTNFYVTPDAFENSIKFALGMTGEERAEMGQAARAWMLQNDAAFRKTLPGLLETIVHG